MLIELNPRYPWGLAAVSAAFNTLWYRYLEQAGGGWSAAARYGSPVLPTVPEQLAVLAPNLYQCVLSRATVLGDSRLHSVTLLQGAFSHWSFAGATGNPFDAPEDARSPAHRGRSRRDS
jgi:hypothetical protein